MFSERTNWNLAPNRLSEALAVHLAAGKRLYDLSASNPTEVGFSVNAEALLNALQNPAALTYVPDPKGIVRARQLSRATLRNIKQNLFFAFIYNSVGVPIAAGVLYPFFGLLLSPIFAAAAMSLSSVSVIANSLRLRTVSL